MNLQFCASFLILFRSLYIERISNTIYDYGKRKLRDNHKTIELQCFEEPRIFMTGPITFLSCSVLLSRQSQDLSKLGGISHIHILSSMYTCQLSTCLCEELSYIIFSVLWVKYHRLCIQKTMLFQLCFSLGNEVIYLFIHTCIFGFLPVKWDSVWFSRGIVIFVALKKMGNDLKWYKFLNNISVFTNNSIAVAIFFL